MSEEKTVEEITRDIVDAGQDHILEATNSGDKPDATSYLIYRIRKALQAERSKREEAEETLEVYQSEDIKTQVIEVLNEELQEMEVLQSQLAKAVEVLKALKEIAEKCAPKEGYSEDFKLFWTAIGTADRVLAEINKEPTQRRSEHGSKEE